MLCRASGWHGLVQPNIGQANLGRAMLAHVPFLPFLLGKKKEIFKKVQNILLIFEKLDEDMNISKEGEISKFLSI